MSNFQRTRSKVWWGDSPPNIGSPVAGNWAQDSKQNKSIDDWEPQLPHWIGNDPSPPQIPEPAVQNAVGPWPLRHGSPGSHKSQDSGFSDSDTSPPASQCYSSPEKVVLKNKSSNSDTNNNESEIKTTNMHTPVICNKSVPKIVIDEIHEVSPVGEAPRPRLRSSSVIQTPYDLQKYYEIHCDEEHIDLLRDKETKDETNENTAKNARRHTGNKLRDVSNTVSNIKGKKISFDQTESKEKSTAIISKPIPPKTLNFETKENPTSQFISSETNSKSIKSVKLAKVKDLETSNQKTDESLAYIQLCDTQIAVNNQPRVRSPISNVSFLPETNQNNGNPRNYRRSFSHEDHVDSATELENFQRNRLNKSLNYEAQKLDEQILDIQDSYHSLGYIEENVAFNIYSEQKKFTAKNITDSLQLKPHKKIGVKAKQRNAKQDKNKEQVCNFRIFPNKREKPSSVCTHAGGTLEGSRVPSLGLPRCEEQDQWVIVGHPEPEKLICNSNQNVTLSPDSRPKESKIRKISPPVQFRDLKSHGNENSALDLKSEKLKNATSKFAENLQLGSASTPKMVTPQEFMNSLETPSNIKSTKIRRINLIDTFGGPSDEASFKERSLDKTPLERLSEKKPEPVQYWLCDLIGSCEPECMTTLQSKAVGAEHRSQVASSAATITGNIKKVQTHGQIIVHQYSDVIKNIEEGSPNEEQICLLVANINEFVLTHSITLNTRPPGETPERWDRIKKSLQSYLQKLIDVGEDIKVELNDSNSEWKVVRKHLDTLTSIFLETTKAVLVQQLRTLVSIIEEPPSDVILKSTLASVGHLAMMTSDGVTLLHEACSKMYKQISELPFVECAVPRALLTAIIETNKSSVKALSLRALATICVSGEAVKQFEEGGGIEIISDILGEESNPEPQMREAITVLTQVTAPWLSGHCELTQLPIYLDPIVKHITEILVRTECCQLLLLCTACLVNLVRRLEIERKEPASVDICDVITAHNTLERLLDAVKRRGPNISVFLQEQTASLLAAVSESARLAAQCARAPAACHALAGFARAALPPALAAPARPAETRARARLALHAAAALARFTLIEEVCLRVAELEAVPCLVKLVRAQRTRPSMTDTNDQLLIHALNALRNIYAVCPEAFTDSKDVDDMIKPRLMESLMVFSSKQESYV